MRNSWQQQTTQSRSRTQGWSMTVKRLQHASLRSRGGRMHSYRYQPPS